MPEESPKDTEHIVGSLTNLDTARMTVRWALERIRFLEQANNEMLELLRGARQSKDQVLKELEDAKQSADKRLSTIAQKERFVGEMQGMLNSLFKGQIDLKDVLDAKTRLEEHKAAADAQAQARVQEAEAKARKQEEEFQKRLVELEANYSRSIGDGERRYQDQLQDLQRQRHEETLEVAAREGRFKEKLLEEVQKQADQYHQKLSILQFEFSAKRQDLQKEFDELKEKVFAEARHVEMRQADTFRLSKEHWEAERKRLEGLIADRERDLAQSHEAMRLATERLKGEQAEAIEHRENELRALEARLRQELATEQAKREAELKNFEERVRTESEEARHREERRLEDLNRRIEEERGRHREELASLQASFDSRLSLAVQEQLRVREDELAKRLDAADKAQVDYQERLARTAQQYQDRITQIETRAAAEVEASRADARRLLEEQAERHLRDLDTARAQGRGLELQLEEELKAERARTLKAVEEQTRRDRQGFDAIEVELRRELVVSQAELQRLTETHAKELQAALDARQQLRESFETQLRAELAAHQSQNQALEKHLAEREAQWRAEHEKRASELDIEIVQRAKRAEEAFQERLKGLEEENKRMAALRAQDSDDASRRQKALQDQFESKLAAEVKSRVELTEKQWHIEKAALEQRMQTEKTTIESKAQSERTALEQRSQAEKYAFAQKLQSERATLELKAQEGLAAAEARWRDQVAASAAKAEAAEKRADELSGQIGKLAARADLAEKKTFERPPLLSFSLPWKRVALVAAGAATLAAAGTGGWYLTQRGASHPIPLTHASALVWSGDTLWVSDASDQAIYELALGKKGFETRERHALAGVSPLSLALAPDKLFLVDGVTGQIQRRALDKDLTLLGTIASPGPKPGALYYDGRSLWSADRQNGYLYKHADDETLSVLESFPLGPDAAALQADGDGFWWAGAQSRLFTRLGPPPALAKLETLALPELEASRKPLGGFAWKGGRLWLALDGEATVLERPRWRLRKR